MTTETRELLELAAKAAGMRAGHGHGEYALHPALECLSTRRSNRPWPQQECR